jgi:hypothetical protein
MEDGTPLMPWRRRKVRDSFLRETARCDSINREMGSLEKTGRDRWGNKNSINLIRG